MADESGLLQSIIDEILPSGIQGDQMEGEGGVPPSMIDELHYLNIQQDQREVKVVLLELSLMNFILAISN